MEEIKIMEEGLKATFVLIPYKTSSGTAYTNLFSLAKACHVNPIHFPLNLSGDKHKERKSSG